MPKSKKGGEESTLLDFGVEEGEEVSIGDVAWVLLTVPVGCILEVCLAGCSVGMGTEEWFAILVREVNLDDESGLLVGGGVLGCENTTYLPELVGTLSTGFIHLCKGDPCEKESERVVHATKVRLWRLRNFNATYLSRQGKAIMKNALNAESGIAPPKVPAKAPAGAAPKRRAKSKAQAPQALASQGIRVGAGECIDLEADGEPSAGEYGSADASQRAHLRSILQETRQRIAGGGGPRPRQPAEGLAGGAGLGPTGSAVAERRLVAGTALNPGVLTPLPIGPSVDTSDDEVRRLKKRLNAKGDASSVLLAQAVQTSQRKNKEKKDKKEGSTDRTIRKLAELLGGKKKKKKKRKDRGSGGHRGETSGIKPDPEGGDGSGPSSSSSSSSRSHRRRRKDDSSEDSELSYEAPLRKKAAKEPGSVMEMLVRHAQQQLDQGALLEEGGAAAGLTSGIKISTYLNPRAMKPLVSYNALRCGAFNGAKGGAMIGCSGTMYVVQWCGVMVRVWCDGTVQWCDGTVQWCDGTVQWCDGAVQCPIVPICCTSVPQCTHRTAPKKLLPKRVFLLPKLAFLLTKNVFLLSKNGAVGRVQWCS